ncbi:MAG: hypothetical protein BJ554DRAFT_7479, partial [Olpidium bornovanus]
PVVSTPVVSTPVVSTPVVSTPVVSTPVVSTPYLKHFSSKSPRIRPSPSPEHRNKHMLPLRPPAAPPAPPAPPSAARRGLSAALGHLTRRLRRLQPPAAPSPPPAAPSPPPSATCRAACAASSRPPRPLRRPRPPAAPSPPRHHGPFQGSFHPQTIGAAGTLKELVSTVLAQSSLISELTAEVKELRMAFARVEARLNEEEFTARPVFVPGPTICQQELRQSVSSAAPVSSALVAAPQNRFAKTRPLQRWQPVLPSLRSPSRIEVSSFAISSEAATHCQVSPKPPSGRALRLRDILATAGEQRVFIRVPARSSPLPRRCFRRGLFYFLCFRPLWHSTNHQSTFIHLAATYGATALLG